MTVTFILESFSLSGAMPNMPNNERVGEMKKKGIQRKKGIQKKKGIQRKGPIMGHYMFDSNAQQAAPTSTMSGAYGNHPY
jgi:hypothetical protein